MKKSLALFIMMMSVFTYVAISQEANPAEKKDANTAEGQNRQGGGPRNFDPAKMMQMYMDRIKNEINATDEEWTELKPLVEKVMSISRESRMQMGSAFARRRPGQDSDGKSEQPASELGKAVQNLQNLLDKDNSTPEEIKISLQALRDARKKSAEELTKAKAALVEKLGPRQESKLVMMGIID